MTGGVCTEVRREAREFEAQGTVEEDVRKTGTHHGGRWNSLDQTGGIFVEVAGVGRRQTTMSYMSPEPQQQLKDVQLNEKRPRVYQNGEELNDRFLERKNDSE